MGVGGVLGDQSRLKTKAVGLRDLVWPFTVSSSKAWKDMVLSNLPRLGELSWRGKLRHQEGTAGRGVTVLNNKVRALIFVILQQISVPKSTTSCFMLCLAHEQAEKTGLIQWDVHYKWSLEAEIHPDTGNSTNSVYGFKTTEVMELGTGQALLLSGVMALCWSAVCLFVCFIWRFSVCFEGFFDFVCCCCCCFPLVILLSTLNFQVETHSGGRNVLVLFVFFSLACHMVLHTTIHLLAKRESCAQILPAKQL